jgi:fructoselysine-6-P-deglycase FrlB-like protein
VNEKPDWLLPYFPELREGPPWVTEDMIVAQAGLAPVVRELAGPAAEVARECLRAARERAPVVLSGSGTAEHGAMAVAELLEDALRRRGAPSGAVEARESFEAALDPRDGGVFLAVSHGGRSRSTVEALEAARGTGARTVLLTAAADAPAAAAADHVLVTPLRDLSFCHTVAYLSPILAGGAIAAAIEDRIVDETALGAHLRAALGTRAACASVARELHGVVQLLAIGDGVDHAAARELALKVEEAVRLPSTARRLETMLHGHLVATDGSTGLLLLVTDPRHRERRAERGESALSAARRIGLRTAAVVTPDLADRFGPGLASAGTVVVPESKGLTGVLSSLVATAFALQLLTLELVHEAGVNPDLIRREEAPYREAAELTQAKIR